MVVIEGSDVHFNDPTDSFNHTTFDLEDAILELIRGAKERVHLISYSLPTYTQNWWLFDSLEYVIGEKGVKLVVHAHRHGEVEGLIDRHRGRGAKGWAWKTEEGGQGIFHIKAIMVDGKRLYLGSANLSNVAIGSSAEWGVVADSPDICRELERYLKQMENAGRFRRV